ncbi:hypothetical protein DFH09DRAFT_1321176 [Mycena vulgaris]|nr:hypothetical protein DFH09DRAFT_1321176 [Mycena vulgaris]
MFSKLSATVTSVLIVSLWVLGLLGLDLDGLNVPLGGAISVTCDAPEKEWGGLIAINCIPITA